LCRRKDQASQKRRITKGEASKKEKEEEEVE
jgi:hypothetical protein